MADSEDPPRVVCPRRRSLCPSRRAWRRTRGRTAWSSSSCLRRTSVGRRATDPYREARGASRPRLVSSRSSLHLFRISLSIMLTRRPAGGDALRSLERLEAIRTLVPAVQETRLGPSVPDRHDLVDGRDAPTGGPLPVGAEGADVHDDGDLRRLLVRHTVDAAHDLDGLVGPGSM